MAPYELSDDPWPGKYVKVRRAGVGTCGDFFYALPKAILPQRSIENANLAQLSKQLVGVKIFKKATPFEAEHEVETLSLIKSRYPQMNRIAQILDSGTVEEDYQWLGTQPVRGYSLTRYFGSMPKYLIFHIFAELVSVLGYLHNMEPGGIVHCDIHLGNVMLDIQTQDRPGLPNVILIDFGAASIFASTCEEESEAKNRQSAQDIADMCDVVQELIESSCDYRDSHPDDVSEPILEWDDPFTRYLLQITASFSLASIPSLDTVWSLWGKRASAECALAPKVLREDIANLWDINEMEADICRAVSGYWAEM